MPSNAMIHYKASLYPEQSDELERLRQLEGTIPTNRIFRESLLYVLANPDALKDVLEKCRAKQYRKTGANVGVHQQEERKRRERAKKKAQ